jgi:hypothetical protein
VFVGALMVLVAQTAAAAGGFTAGQVMADLNLPADAVARLRISWARLLTKPPGAVLNGERRPEGRKPGRAFVNECSRSTSSTGPSAVAP